MKPHSYYARLAISLVVLALSGCSTVYTPAPGIPNLKEIPEFPSGLKLSLVNAQPNAEKIVLVSGGGSTYYANLHDWTERLNKSLKETLQKRHVEVVDGAPKSLKLAIEKAVVNMQAGGFNPRCTLDWKVELGDGTTIPMTLETGHWKIEDAANVAVRLACRDTLRNDRVGKYLTSP